MAMTRRNLMYFYGMSAIGQVAIHQGAICMWLFVK
jgi:hypothetical protein